MTIIEDLGDPAVSAVADYRARRRPDARGRTIDGNPQQNLRVGIDEVEQPQANYLIQTIYNNIASINTRLAAATITCNGDGTITLSI